MIGFINDQKHPLRKGQPFIWLRQTFHRMNILTIMFQGHVCHVNQLNWPHVPTNFSFSPPPLPLVNRQENKPTEFSLSRFANLPGILTIKKQKNNNLRLGIFSHKSDETYIHPLVKWLRGQIIICQRVIGRSASCLSMPYTIMHEVYHSWDHFVAL